MLLRYLLLALFEMDFMRLRRLERSIIATGITFSIFFVILLTSSLCSAILFRTLTSVTL